MCTFLRRKYKAFIKFCLNIQSLTKLCRLIGTMFDFTVLFYIVLSLAVNASKYSSEKYITERYLGNAFFFFEGFTTCLCILNARNKGICHYTHLLLFMKIVGFYNYTANKWLIGVFPCTYC